jgi:phage tail sheath protein FI
VTVEPTGRDMPVFVAADLALDPKHRRGGAPDSVFAYFAAQPASLSRSRTIPIVISTEAPDGLAILQDFIDAYVVASPVGSPPDLGIEGNLLDDDSPPARRSLVVNLRGGGDGLRPFASHYAGEVDGTTDRKTGLKQFEDIEDISIVAAPGSTAIYDSQTQGILSQLIIHAERMRYRIAVLDSVKDQTISEVREMRALFDSSHAALYYPWVRVIDPLSQEEINVPPSGHVAGIYARNDIERAVYKAPANEVVNLAIGFEKLLNKSQQEVLNPEGINCFRFFEGRGMRLWGARTISSDPEWKYVNLRRYFAYLERSIDKGTQWAVFEPNGPQLWANVRRTLEDFLLNEWQNGALLGDKPERSFFVKCDRSTMTQNDLDNGRLVCLIGVAPLRPAEFVIFRIGQWTADRKI